jgi:hypothetical protein
MTNSMPLLEELARPASPVFGGVIEPVPVVGAVTVGAGAAGCEQVTVTWVVIGAPGT